MDRRRPDLLDIADDGVLQREKCRHLPHVEQLHLSRFTPHRNHRLCWATAWHGATAKPIGRCHSFGARRIENGLPPSTCRHALPDTTGGRIEYEAVEQRIKTRGIIQTPFHGIEKSIAAVYAAQSALT